MGKPFILDISDLSSGLNEAAAETIGETEAAELENFYVLGKSLQQAPGRVSISSAYSERILSITRYNPSFSSEETILGCASSIARLVGSTITPLTIADGRIYPSSTKRWWFRQYNDELFACQQGNGGLKRIYGTSVIEAGIEAPTVEPQIVDGGAGQKSAGEYRLAYTFYNPVTGAESNLSPLSKSITIAADHFLSASQIGVSSNLQVGARRIYVTLPDDLGTFYLVGQIDDNTTTTYTENALPPDDYGAAFESANGLPPAQAHCLEVYKERLFVTDSDGFYWSELAKPQSFKATNYFPIAKGSGYKITGLKAWDEHGLVIFAQDRVFILRGNTPSDWTVEILAEGHGCPDGQSAIVADGVLYWYTGVNFVRSGGSGAEILPQIDRLNVTLAGIAEADKEDVQGAPMPSLGHVLWTLKSGGAQKIVVFDYRSNVFLLYTGAPDTIRTFVKDSQSEVVLAASSDDDEVVEYLYGSAGMQPARWRSKAFGSTAKSLVRILTIECPRTNGDATLRIVNNVDGTIIASRTVSMYRHGPKRVAISTSGNPAMLYQVEVYWPSATVALRLDRVRIQGVELTGRLGVVL